MTEVLVEDRTSLLSDNGSGYVSRAFRDYLHLVGIHHINVTPDDVLQGRRDSILARRKEVQAQTLRRRQLQNQQIRQLNNSPSLASSLR